MRKHRITVVVVAVAALFSSFTALGEAFDTPDAGHGFAFVVELSSEGVHYENPGVAGDGFCVRVEATGSDAVIRSLAGTEWTQVSYGCGDSETCAFLASETGVQGL